MPINSFLDYPMSWKPQINKHEKPLYRVLANILETDIQRGLLKPGDKLPPQRELADFLDINLSTVTRAFKICEMKGLIDGTIGRGTYISQDVKAHQPMLLQEEPHGLINLGASHPLAAQNHYVTKVMKQILKKTSVENLFNYAEPLGKESHRKSGVKWLQHFHLSPKAEDIMITSGLQNALTVILASLFEAGDKIAVPPLLYPGFKNIANMLGLRLVPIPFQHTSIDPEILARKCRVEKIKGIYLSPDYHNPTTFCMSMAERHDIADVVKKNHLICIEDATYSFLQDNITVPLCAYIPEQCIYVSTVSNSICCGLRISFLRVPDPYKTDIADGIRNINVMSSPFDAETVSKIIDTGLAAEITQNNKREICNRNQIANEILCNTNLLGDHNCQFRWLYLTPSKSSSDFERLAMEHGIQIFSSERFSVGNVATPPAIRIAITSPKTIRELENGLSILQQLISTWQ